LKDLLTIAATKQPSCKPTRLLVRGERMTDAKLFFGVSINIRKHSAQIISDGFCKEGSFISKSSNLGRLKENFDVFDFQISPEGYDLIDNSNENYRVVG
jgi:diketogulonate reductase-like aldo/keto reductase